MVLICSNGYWFEVAALAIMAGGNVVVPIPINADAEAFKSYAKQFDLKLILYEDKFADKILDLKIKNVQITKIFDIKAKTRKIIENINPDQPACILLTGGTTGRPKGVVLSHKALLCGMKNGCFGLDNVFFETYYCLIPLTHSFGFVRNMLCSFFTGSLIYYNTDKLLIFNELPKIRPTVLILVPALAELFLKLMLSKSKDIVGDRLKTIICGSANVPAYLTNEYAKFGIKFCPGYDLTEFANIVTGNPIAKEKPTSVGLLFPKQKAKIVDGELWLKGDNMFNCYYNDRDKTTEAMSKDGWFKTGDLAEFNKDNYIYINGRIKDTIVAQWWKSSSSKNRI